MTWEDHIELNPAVLVGKPVVKGTRISVELVIELLAQGWDEATLLEDYPGLTREDVRACLHYAAGALRAERVYPLNV